MQSSLKKSIDIGLDSVELDVWLTKDMIPVVIQEENMEKLKNLPMEKEM